MTLTRPYSPISYVGNNEQKEFPFNFEEISTDLVKCFITRDDGTRYVPAFVINKEYDTGEEKEYRCVLELNTPLLDTEVITIYRETPQVQDTPFRTLQGYDARALENILSKIVAMIQEINDHNISMDITNGDWTFDVIKENLDKASLIIDFPAKKITTGLYFKIEDGYLYVSQDGEHYIKIADAEDVSDLTRRVEECETIAGEANQKSEQAVNTANTALTTAEEARVKSQDAIDTSLTALNIANEASDKSDRAVADSAQALNIANQANTKSDEAKSIAQEANTKSNQAISTANNADAKSDQAITTSQEALSGVQSAIEAAESATTAAQQATEVAERAERELQTYDGRITEAQNNASEALSKVDEKQDKLQFVITEDMFDRVLDDTKGVAPYSTSYGYTNITIHEDAGVEWVDGAMYSFVLDTKVATSANRNVRVRIGESGDWKPVMVTSSIAAGSSVFIKAVNSVFFYKTTYQPNGALHCLYDTNTTYTINYSLDAGQKKAGVGAYAVSRYSLIMEKPDGTWEKITDTTKNYTTATSKTVNKCGFLLNQIRYYNYTTNYANGALISASYVYSKSASANGSYSFNCGTAPGWAIGDYIYIVGTVKDDGLFYLDETKWWDNKLPTTKDGKLYIQLGNALTTTDSTFSLLEERPILYYDDGIKLYGGNGGGKVESVNGKDGIVVLTGEDISADVSELTDTIQGHLQTLHDNIKDIELFKFPNATIIGNPTIDHGQVSGFTANDYLQFPFIVDLHNQPFVIDFCFTTGNDVTTQQNILDSQFGLALAIANGKGLMAISHNGTSWAGSVVGTLAMQPNTTYYARLSWNRINYKTELSTDGKTYVADMNFGSTQSPYPRTMFIGGCSGSVIGHTAHPFGGTINMNYAYLTVAGNVIWQGMDDAGLSTRANVSLDNLDEFGQAKFDEKQNKLVAGANITIDEETNTISATGGSSSGSGRNIGDIFYTTRNDESLGGAVECNGGTYSTADYAGAGSIGELLASGKLPYVSLADYATQITNNGVCGMFGWDGTGTTTFRVPTLKDMFIECGQASELGDYVSAGLPNIAASVQGSKEVRLSLYEGAFYGEDSKSQSGSATVTGSDYHKLNFDASRSNSIYGNSTTVQPEAVKYRAMVQLFNATTDEAVATVGTVVAQVGELRNMSNITATGKETVVGWGMPDYTAGVSKTWNTDTTATTDCLVLCRSASNNTASDSLRFYIDGALIGDYVIANSGIFILTFFVSKGHTYKATGTRGSSMLIEYPLKGVN